MTDELIGARWVLSGHGVSIEYSGTTNEMVSAADVVCAEFKQQYRVGLPQRPPSADLADCTFRRFPLTPTLVVKVSQFTGVRTVLSYGEGVEFESFPERDDQMILGRMWCPVDEGALAEIRTLLQTSRVQTLGVIPLGAYVALARSRSPFLRIEFTAEDDEESLPPRPDTSRLKASLYPYQEKGLRWLSFMSRESLGCILGDEMGLGKTIQVIALLCAELETGRRPTLIVAPATLMENWRRELAKFTSGVCVLVHEGPNRTGFPTELARNDAVITSYDTLVRDLSLFRMLDWNLVVADEAQAIKNPVTLRAKAIRSLRRRVAFAVTGTPFQNHVTDLWSIVDFAIPGAMGDLKTFQQTYDDSLHSATALEQIISPIMLRRRISDVAVDLPPRIEIPEAIPLDPAAAGDYETIRQQSSAGNLSLSALTTLRMFCTHPFLSRETTGDPAAASSKYRRLTEILTQIFAAREKALIFTSYTRMIDILSSDLPTRFGVPTSFIDGRTPVPSRQGLVDSYSAIDGPAVLVLNPHAAGVGLNITASNHVIHYNLEWNPAVEDQASSRSHRLGQLLPVTIHRLFHSNTIEEVIEDRLMRKRSLADAAIVGTSGDALDATDIARALRVSPIA